MKSRPALACAFFCLIGLIAAVCSLTDVSGRIEARADREQVDALPTIVEAESCLWEDRTDCTTDGIWHEWELRDLCSGDYCIVNEHPSGSGTPVSATLTLTDVQGSGIGIRYRQDTWYGTLGVRIDSQPDYCIQQKGVTEYQSEACFELDGSEPLTITLFLTGTETTDIITGVISADAIKVYDTDAACGAQESLCSRDIIVPAYFAPTAPLAAPSGTKYWDRLADAARILGDRLIVIVNVYNGPGGPDDPDYTEVISNVVANGGKVIGYVHTCYANQTQEDAAPNQCWRRIHDILDDIDKWLASYPSIDGVFFDEVAVEREDINYYQTLRYYLQWRLLGAMTVLNFGAEPHPDYLDIDASVYCTYEGPSACFVGWLPPRWLQRERSCALVYGTGPDPAGFLESVSKKRFEWAYGTDDTNGYANPWNTLPDYFEQLVSAVSCRIYLPTVLKGWP